MEGYRVMPIAEAAKIGDLFLTVTGDKHVVDVEHLLSMKDGAFVANAGHFDWEVNVGDLKSYATEIKQIRPFLEEYKLNNGKSVLCSSRRKTRQSWCCRRSSGFCNGYEFC